MKPPECDACPAGSAHEMNDEARVLRPHPMRTPQEESPGVEKASQRPSGRAPSESDDGAREPSQE